MPAGIFFLQAYYKASGPYWDVHSHDNQRLVEGIWAGEATSNIVRVEVVLPEGEDRNALLHFGVPFDAAPDVYADFIGTYWKQLLKDHPKSTYAAQFIADHIPPPDIIPAKAMRRLLSESSDYPPMQAVPDPESPTGWREIPGGPPMAEWQFQKAKEILASNPDLPIANRLRLVLAINGLVLKNNEEANQQLQYLAARQETKEGRWAKSFLDSE